ncbi:MAG: hypothetical protein ABWY20_19380 [Mycobacterium sp.]
MPCALCGDDVGEWGNNPEPLGNFDARVCDACNARFVIPARLGTFTDSQVHALRILITASAAARGVTHTNPN